MEVTKTPAHGPIGRPELEVVEFHKTTPIQ